MTKLTRSRRPAADARAARNTLLTAADLAAPEDCEGEIGAGWTPALDSAFSPRRSRRQPARPRSTRVGSRAMAMAAAKAIDCLPIVGKRGRGVAAGAQAGELGQPPRKRVEAHTAVACQITPLPSPVVNPRAVLLVAVPVVRLALTPVGKAGSLSPHATVPTLGRAEPRLVLVHAAEERGGALGRHEEAVSAGERGGPAGWADSRRGGREEEDGGGRQHASTDAHPSTKTEALAKRRQPIHTTQRVKTVSKALSIGYTIYKDAYLTAL
eukprot:scaffold34434_cov95-Phaeocystis_antarctica.AAC.3